MYLAPSKNIIMNKFKFYFILFSTLLVLFSSCNKDDDELAVTPLRDFGAQFKTDSIAIDKYLQTHYLNLESVTDIASVVNSADLIKKMPTTGTLPPSIFTLFNSPTLPRLLIKKIKKHDIIYSVYYLQFSEGDSAEKPCPLDEVLVTYRGTSLKSGTETQSTGQVEVINATEFENNPTNSKFTLSSTIAGWQEIFPLFGKGTFDETATGNGPNVYSNFGSGIMFLPSGLAYYNGSRTNIPSYSPLVFSFQLLNLKRIDNDGDGIFTIDEIVKNTDYSFTYSDSDGDGIVDFLDFDDDNDGFPTRNEIKKPTPFQGTSLYYPFNPIVDNPLTTDIDESEPKGIPDKSGDFSTPTRVRRHLDKTAKPPYTTY